MGESTRTRSKKTLKKAVGHIETAFMLYAAAMEPYFKNYPMKEKAVGIACDTLSDVKTMMSVSLDDV